MDVDSRTKKVPADPREEAAESGGGRFGWKPLAILGAGCLTMGSLLFLGAMALVSVGLVSCVSSCSDRPIRDTREAAAFIAAHEASERDLVVFDALRGAIDAVYDRLESSARDAEKDERTKGDVTHPMTVDALRSAVASGAWPEDPACFGGSDSSLSPQLWVRIAELSQAHLERETDESWEVVDFAYPFPSSGPVPAPAIRDEKSCTRTLLRCTKGQDQGLYACVRYYRWRNPAGFEHDLDERRAQADQSKELLEKMGAEDPMEGRRFLLDGGNVYLWSTGEDDTLRDPDAFVSLANKLTELTGAYADVKLLAPDTPVTLAHEPISGDFPNERPVETVPFEEARERLLLSGSELCFDNARGDELYWAYRKNEDTEIATGDLRGTLTDAAPIGSTLPSMTPGADCSLEEGFCKLVAEEVGAPSASDVIVLSTYESKDYPGSKVGFADDSMGAWVLIPRGYLPETKAGFCPALERLRDLFWDQIPLTEGHRASLALRVYVIDQDTIKGPDGESLSFAQLRELVAGDATKLKDCKVDVLLGAMPYSTLWREDPERHDSGCGPSDIGGSIARSRAWRYEPDPK